MSAHTRQPGLREIAALPLYLVGAIVWATSAAVLIVADKIANKKYGATLLFK